MITRLRHRLRPSGPLVRGRPHFVPGPPVGPRGMVAWIPEGRVTDQHGQRRVQPIAIIELHATGVRRHPLRSARSRWGLRIGLAVAGMIVCGVLVAWRRRAVPPQR